MKYCNKCGASLAEGAKFCTGCGNKLEVIKEEPKKEVQMVNKEDEKKANMLGFISLGLYFGLPLIGMIFNFFVTALAAVNEAFGILSLLSLITYLGEPAGIVTMIIMRIKYPKNVFGKVLMWVYIGLTAFAILAFIVIILFVILLFYQLRQSSIVY